LPGEEHAPEPRRLIGKARLEAFSDGVFAIAITLLVLDLAIPGSGPALDRVFDAWPFYLAYVVSFLTIGAAWLAHTWITDRLTNADLPLLRLNLLLLLVVALLPFPTRLVAEGLDDVSGERVFVTMSGIALLGIRVLLYALDAYAWRERLYASVGSGEPDTVRQSILPVVVVYTAAILIGLAVPAVAVGLYCAIAVVLVVPFGELRRLLFRRA
jgi:TMEM175 potassium channel family protein